MVKHQSKFLEIILYILRKIIFMKKISILGMILPAMLLGVSCSILSPEKTPLTLNLEKGSAHKLVNSTDIQYFSDATMSEQVMSMTMELTIEYQVVDRDESGTQTLDAKVAKMVLNQSAEGMEILYDSSKPDSVEGMGAMVAEQFSPVLNQSILLKIDSKGEVITDSTAAEEEGLTPKNFMMNAFPKLPEGIVEEGTTWVQSGSDDDENTGPKMTYTVTEVTKDQVTYNFELKNDSTTTLSPELQNADIKTGGTAIYNRKTGEIISNISNSTMKGSNPQMGEFFMISTTKITSSN